ncbi:MAG: glucose 1-dehydrogenase [Peptococcaceae bacterium]|nr:MAG: glucose 1-dehydrogenase [Peptococcaceae bacterium]
MHLKDKVAVVTGAGRGIGRGIALELARHGSNVVVADMRYELAQEVAGEIKGMGQQALAVSTDVTLRTQVKEMVTKTLETFGRIDILVNNAGWDKIEPFVKSTEETWDKVIAINFKGVLYCVREVLDHMIERQYGKIISIGSDAGRVGSSGEAVYSGTKGAVIAFSKTLAREMARYKINVNVVCPGPSDTPLFAEIGQDNPKLVESLKRVIPWGRLGVPEDIAHAVAFLASDEAGFITGQTLSVSGGLTMC